MSDHEEWCEKCDESICLIPEKHDKDKVFDDMLALIKRLNYAFYVDGTSKALRPLMGETKDLIRTAEGVQQ